MDNPWSCDPTSFSPTSHSTLPLCLSNLFLSATPSCRHIAFVVNNKTFIHCIHHQSSIFNWFMIDSYISKSLLLNRLDGSRDVHFLVATWIDNDLFLYQYCISKNVFYHWKASFMRFCKLMFSVKKNNVVVSYGLQEVWVLFFSTSRFEVIAISATQSSTINISRPQHFLIIWTSCPVFLIDYLSIHMRQAWVVF